MRKISLAMILLLAAASTQAQQFQRGTTVVNLGIGLGTSLGGLGKARPAVSLSVDRGIWDIGGPGVISLGGYIGNTGYKYTDLGYTAKWNYTIVGVRGAYHYNGFTNTPALDVYGGAMLGYNIARYSSDADDEFLANSYGSGIGLSGFVGGRWFFTEKLGVHAELGYGVSILALGLTYKF